MRECSLSPSPLRPSSRGFNDFRLQPPPDVTGRHATRSVRMLEEVVVHARVELLPICCLITSGPFVSNALLSHASVVLITSYIQLREYRVAVAMIVSRVLRDQVEHVREVVGCVRGGSSQRTGYGVRLCVRNVPRGYAAWCSLLLGKRAEEICSSESLIWDSSWAEIFGSPPGVDVVHPCAGGLRPFTSFGCILGSGRGIVVGDRNHPTGGLDCSVLFWLRTKLDNDDDLVDDGEVQ